MQGYLPGQLYKLDSSYGNKEELKSLVAALKQAGIRALCDIVINHRCADAQDEHGIWNNFKCALGPSKTQARRMLFISHCCAISIRRSLNDPCLDWSRRAHGTVSNVLTIS